MIDSQFRHEIAARRSGNQTRIAAAQVRCNLRLIHAISTILNAQAALAMQTIIRAGTTLTTAAGEVSKACLVNGSAITQVSSTAVWLSQRCCGYGQPRSSVIAKFGAAGKDIVEPYVTKLMHALKCRFVQWEAL